VSHRLHGERFDYLNSRLDEKWLKLIETDAEKVAYLTHLEIMKSAPAREGQPLKKSIATHRLQSSACDPLLEVRRGEREVRDVQKIADVLVDSEGTLERRNQQKD
jgi:hypothetical protein